MKKCFSILALAMAVGVLTLPVHAQDTGKRDTVAQPALGPTQTLLQAWNDVGRKLIAMAEDFPEDKYDFKPVPVQRSFSEQLLHAAGANYFFVNAATGKKQAVGEDPKRDQYRSKAAVIAFVKKSFEDGAAAITAAGDKGLDNLVTDPFTNQKVRVSDMGWSLLEHSGEHYGQLVVYYRVAGLVPPESRPHK